MPTLAWVISAATQIRSARISNVDIVVVGAGMVGAVGAVLLARAKPSLVIALIESRSYVDRRSGDFNPRVSAITECTRGLLDGCDHWNSIVSHRHCRYTKM
ncbi:MAG: hypothetical protein OSA42_06560 [Porticoccaceae bacterium]|nr:hypothetical protein [Porticoccaceae bacterium]